MAKVKSVTGGFRSVIPVPGRYASIGVSAEFEATLEAGDDPEAVIAELVARSKILVAKELRLARGEAPADGSFV